jgi:hypothetical protein
MDHHIGSVESRALLGERESELDLGAVLSRYATDVEHRKGGTPLASRKRAGGR